MDHVQCKQEHPGDPTQDLQVDVPRNVKLKKEDVMCVKIKEEEIPEDIITAIRRQTRWGSRMSKNLRDSESVQRGLGTYETSSEEAELSPAGPSQLPTIACPVISPRHDTGRGSERGSKRSRKRRREEAEFMESVLHRLTEMNEERSRHLNEMMSQQEMIMRQLWDDEDSDMLFLKSLLPLMKEMPTPKKMECWTAMMDVMARFVAPSSNTHPPSQAPGPFSHETSPHVLPPEPWYRPSGYSSAPIHSHPPHSQRLIAELEEYQYYPV
ncbi:uncharacterized protein LOC142663449 isoform X2 [Rhinoderma darwinii]|uniref:uncharacterized protein LOC142663449 isoform X2 n=1 Tax=Rhinoderma darwinii TaxID=43563 RepID=UPI003F664397